MLVIRFPIVLAAAMLAAVAAPAYGQGDAKEIFAAPPEKLVEILQNPNAPVFDKAKACQRLAVVGTADAVPALAALLADETLNLYARYGLEGIASPAADQALREAAGRLHGRPLVGVLDSLGQRKDAKSVELLQGLLTNSDADVAAAAASALGSIGTPEAAPSLQAALAKEGAFQTIAANACLTCAEGLAAAGNKAEAVALYRAVVQSGAPKPLQIAALQGQFHVLQGEAKELLLEQLRAEDQARFDLGLAVARRLPGADVTAALAQEMNALAPPRQALLLLALADRKEKPPAELFREASRSDAPEVREAAIRVLARSGDAGALPVLLEAALQEGDLAQSARDGLKTLAGEAVDAAIVSKLAGADAKAKIVLFELAGARRLAAAKAAMQASLADANADVRAAALAALAQLVELDDLDVLINRALARGAADPAAQSALQTAALRMSDREGASAKLASRLATTSGDQQVYLLELLGKLGGPKALEAVVASAKSADPATKDAATRVLGEWPNADAASALLNIAKTDREAKYQVRALRGYLRIARQLQLTDDERLAMFRTAMETARRDEEKQLALDVLTRIPSVQTMDLAVSYLNDPAIRSAAADAAVKIAPKVLPTDSKAVVAAMQKIVSANVGGDPANRAKQLLDQAKSGSP